MGGMGRFTNHLSDANCRIQDLNEESGPEFAIVASRDIEPGKKTAVDGPDKRFYCYRGSNKCRDKGLCDDPLISDVVTSRLRYDNKGKPAAGIGVNRYMKLHLNVVN